MGYSPGCLVLSRQNFSDYCNWLSGVQAKSFQWSTHHVVCRISLGSNMLKLVQKFTKVKTNHEYGRLRSVLLGRVNRDFHIPMLHHDPALPHLVNAGVPGEGAADDFHFGPYPQEVLDGAEQQSERFADILSAEGVEVLRVDEVHNRRIPVGKTCHWECPQSLGAYSTRDILLTVDDQVVVCPTPFRSRRFEVEEYFSSFLSTVDPAKVIDLREHSALKDTDMEDGSACPIFDAADLIKVKEGVLAYLVSGKFSNEAGLQLIRDTLPQHTIVPLYGFYNSQHVDTTLAFLNEATILYNSSRVNRAAVKGVFDAFGFTNYIPSPPLSDMVVHVHPLASAAIGLNVLSLDRQTVIVDSAQQPLIDLLHENGFSVIPVAFPFSRDFGGGPHCTTLDIERDE